MNEHAHFPRFKLKEFALTCFSTLLHARTSAAFLLALVSPALFAHGTGQARHGAAPDCSAGAVFTPADIFRLKTVGDARISPDGTMIAYEAGDGDIMIDGKHRSIRLLDVASGRDRLLAEAGSSPRWSPQGSAIAFSTAGPDGATRIMIAPQDGRPTVAPAVVATVAGSPSGFAWSPDGARIAFTMFVPAPSPVAPPISHAALMPPPGATWAAAPRIITTVRYQEDGLGNVDPGHTQLFTVTVASGSLRQVTSSEDDVRGDPAWSADGARLLYSASNTSVLGPTFQIARIYSVTAGGGTPVAISPPGVSAQAPAISPDGRSVAYIGWDADGRDYSPIGLYIVGANGGKARRIGAALDRDFNSPSWSADGRALYIGYAERSVDTVGLLALDSERLTELVRNIDGDFSVSRTGAIAYAAGRPDRPADVAIRNADGATKLLTGRNEVLLAGKALSSSRPLVVHSSLDGQEVGAWLTLPAAHVAGRPGPLVLVIHGGPYGYDSPVWSTRDQLYAAAGYAVLHVNYRGSTSYGFAFADRIAHDPLTPSYADLMSAVDAAVRAGLADPDQLFVTGGSAGGRLTAWIVGHTDRFKAAMAEKPVINAISEALTSDQYTAADTITGPKPWDDPVNLWAQSPLSQVAHVKTPTMMIVGEQDRRTPLSEALQFYDALTIRRVPTALVVVPGASHATLGAVPSQLAAMMTLTLDWFGRFGHPGASAAARCASVAPASH